MPPHSGCTHLHAEAEIVKPGDQAFRELSLGAAVEVVGAEVTIFHAVSQNMVGGGEDRGRGARGSTHSWCPWRTPPRRLPSTGSTSSPRRRSPTRSAC